MSQNEKKFKKANKEGVILYIGYIDESGYVGSGQNPEQPVQVMACILSSVYNFPKTNREFRIIINILKDHNIPLSELKAKEIYRGRGVWRNVEGKARHKIFDLYLRWLVNRKLKVLLSIIDNDKFFNLKRKNNTIAVKLVSPYVAGAIHIGITIQKYNKNKKDNKGKTIIIFDEQKEFQDEVEELFSEPPEFTDEYYNYNKEKDKEKLNQIIDTAYFVKSHYSNIIQVADTIAFISRLYIEFEDYNKSESYQGEFKRIAKWFSIIKNKIVDRSSMYPQRNGDIFDFYRVVAPMELPF